MPKFDSNSARKAGKKSSRAGVPNKANAALRERVHALIDDNYQQVVRDIKSLKPRERVDAWLKLLEYALPKLQRSEMSIDITNLSDEEVDRLLNRVIEKWNNHE